MNVKNTPAPSMSKGYVLGGSRWSGKSESIVDTTIRGLGTIEDQRVPGGEYGKK